MEKLVGNSFYFAYISKHSSLYVVIKKLSFSIHTNMGSERVDISVADSLGIERHCEVDERKEIDGCCPIL